MNENIILRNLNVLLFIVFFTINCFQPLVADDFCRSIVSALSNHTMINSLISDYYGWSGRVTAQILVYVFFNKPYQIYLNILFNLLNAFFLISFIKMTFYISIENDTLKKTAGNFLVFLFLFLCILIFSGFFKNLMWKTVGLQYFWGIWLLVYLYFNQFHQQEVKLNNKFLLVLLGLCVGLYNEIYFAIVLGFSVAYLFSYLLSFQTNSQKENLKNIIMFSVGNLMGGIILIIAPGNYVRQRNINADHFISYKEKLHCLINAYLEHKFFIVITALVILIILIDRQKSKTLKTLTICSVILMLIITLPVGNYGLSGRMLMLQYVVISIILFQYLFSLNFLCTLIKKTPIIILILPNIISLSILLYAYYNLFHFNYDRHIQITNYIRNGNLNANFTRYKPRFNFCTKLVYFDDIEIDNNDFKNGCFAAYYNFKTVQLDHND